MKKLLLLLLIVLMSCSSSINWNTYTDKINHYSIQYPEKWEKEAKGNTVVFLSPIEGSRDLFKENVNIMFQDLSQQKLTLEEYTNLTKEMVVVNLGEQSIISINDAIINDFPAKEFVYKMNLRGKHLKIKQYWFIRNEKAYLFSYTAEPSTFKDYEAIATKIVESFKFL